MWAAEVSGLAVFERLSVASPVGAENHIQLQSTTVRWPGHTYKSSIRETEERGSIVRVLLGWLADRPGDRLVSGLSTNWPRLRNSLARSLELQLTHSSWLNVCRNNMIWLRCWSSKSSILPLGCLLFRPGTGLVVY